MGSLTRVLERSMGGRGDRERMSRRVEEMADRLAEEEHSRARFVSKVSHELRTPLTVIKGYVYTLQRSETDPAKLARLDVINGECERLAYLVEDLLELSRARAGELRVAADAFPLRGCVEEVVESLRTVAEQRHVAVETAWQADGELVMGDRNRIRQVFANLLTNGLKYSPADSRVTVRGEVADGQVVVSVQDRGRGIAAHDLPHVFDEFFQGAHRPEPGAGLGLAIARELTEAHGGSIDVRSVVGEGTCFTVRLPVWREGR
jgi:two-component system sensor histidine kinase BaeS